ncbi:MAG: amidase [Anaeromyxobacteraceae bacterium]
MLLPEYDALDATAMAALVASRGVSPGELVEAALQRVAAHGVPLGAIAHRLDDAARAAAAGPLPQGPFTGVPFLVKDLSTSFAGLPLTWGSRMLEGHVAREDSETARRLLGAGLVVVATTSTAELGLLPVTETALGGACRNPWDRSRTPGGSSGGSGAAVAARIAPAAHGSDGGGSLRIPASACGLFTVKPTRGRVSASPDPEAWSGLSSEGVLTRSVRDGAALLDVLAGAIPSDPYTAPPRARPYAAEVTTAPGRLRIAFTTGGLLGGAVHEECRAAVLGAARLLSDLGHDVAEDAPRLDGEALLRAATTLICANVASDVAEMARRSGRRPGRETLEAATLGALIVGRRLPAQAVVDALRAAHAARRALAAFHERYDLLVTATTPEPALPLGAMAPTRAEEALVRALSGPLAPLATRKLVERLVERMAPGPQRSITNTAPFNLTGQPAASLPLHVTAAGLPVGVQLAAALGGEATIFRVAAQLEAARPWADRRPPALDGP